MVGRKRLADIDKRRSEHFSIDQRRKAKIMIRAHAIVSSMSEALCRIIDETPESSIYKELQGGKLWRLGTMEIEFDEGQYVVVSRNEPSLRFPSFGDAVEAALSVIDPKDAAADPRDWRNKLLITINQAALAGDIAAADALQRVADDHLQSKNVSPMWHAELMPEVVERAQWGGRRNGAGRPKAAEPLRSKSIRLSDDDLACITRVQGEQKINSLSGALRWVISQAEGREIPKPETAPLGSFRRGASMLQSHIDFLDSIQKAHGLASFSEALRAVFAVVR